jgi:hypothetical protein
MSRRAPWRNDLHTIKERIAHSKVEYYQREDFEELFQVKRVTAGKLMHATGAIQNLGRVYAVSRHDLMDLVERFINTDDVNRVLNNLLDKAPEPPDSKPIRVEIPEQCKYIRLNELPNNIVIEAGKLEIKGDGLTIIHSLGLLARALEAECDLFIKICNQAPETDRKLSKLLDKLRLSLNPDGSPVELSQRADPATATNAKEESVTFLTGSPEW